MSTMTMQREALERATTGESTANYDAIMAGFVAKGIPADEILPRMNVLTFNAWKAAGRTVKRGEHGVKITTWIEFTAKHNAAGQLIKAAGKRPKFTTVFHLSQTEEVKS